MRRALFEGAKGSALHGRVAGIQAANDGNLGAALARAEIVEAQSGYLVRQRRKVGDPGACDFIRAHHRDAVGNGFEFLFAAGRRDRDLS